MKYPIGIQTFERIVEGNFVYVDKTALVYKLVTEGNIYFLSRPRRFGKSLLVSTLKSYFQGKKELFSGLAMETLVEKWDEYPILHIDFNGDNFTAPGTLAQKIEGIVQTWELQWGASPVPASIGDRLAYTFRMAHQKTGRGVVVLVDEYDKPLLDVMDLDIYDEVGGKQMRLEDVNRELLKGFYGVFKSADADLAFVFLTGVTKFSQVSVFSGFNQPKDISMNPCFDALCGITEEELLHYFAEPIRTLASAYDMSEEQIVQRLRRQYDGYHFSSGKTGVYNPFSLLNCFDRQQIENFWFATGTPSYLVRLLQGSDIDINEMISRPYRPAAFMASKALHAEPLPMIYQSGYLTVKSYNKQRDTYRLDFPNQEVRSGFIDVLSTGYFKQDQTTWLNKVADALEAGDIPTFEKLLTALLATITYRFQHKGDPVECERYFQLTFFLILQMIGTYTIYAEKETSEGRIDCVIETNDYVYLVEIKRDGSADAALAQVAERGYAKPYVADRRKVFCVGVNFSSATGNIHGFRVEQA